MNAPKSSYGAALPGYGTSLVDPINIYAKLDADVRVRLDKELQDLLAENPNLF